MDDLHELCIIALENASYTHDKLCGLGLKRTKINRFGDITLRAGWDCEEAIIKTFRDAKIPVRIISEEHGIVDLHSSPRYLAILGGLDNSKVYEKAPGKGRYATILGVFSNLNPRYADYLFQGSIEHVANRLYFALPGQGSVVKHGRDIEPIHCSSERALSCRTNIYMSSGSFFSQGTAPPNILDFTCTNLGSAAVHYIDLARGKADLVIEGTRKGNITIATSFGLVQEAGGVCMTLDVPDLGQLPYLGFGQSADEAVLLISAATRPLAEETCDYLLNYGGFRSKIR